MKTAARCPHTEISSFTFSDGSVAEKCKACDQRWNKDSKGSLNKKLLHTPAPLKLSRESQELKIQKIIRSVISRFLPKDIRSNHLIAGENGAQKSTTGVADDLQQQCWIAILDSPTFKQLQAQNNTDGQLALAWQTAKGTILNWRKKEQDGLKTIPVSQMNLQSVDPESNDAIGREEVLLPWDRLHTSGDNPNAAILAGADSDLKRLILLDLRADKPDDYTFVHNYLNRDGNASKPDQDRFARIKARLQKEYDLLDYKPEGVLSEQEAGERYLAKLGAKGGLNAKGKPKRQSQQRAK